MSAVDRIAAFAASRSRLAAAEADGLTKTANAIAPMMPRTISSETRPRQSTCWRGRSGAAGGGGGASGGASADGAGAYSIAGAPGAAAFACDPDPNDTPGRTVAQMRHLTSEA